MLLTVGLYGASGITGEPTDNMFVACAMEAEADFIVAGDPHPGNLKYHLFLFYIKLCMPAARRTTGDWGLEVPSWLRKFRQVT